MRATKKLCLFLLLASVFWLGPSLRSNAQQPASPRPKGQIPNGSSGMSSKHGSVVRSESAPLPAPESGGLREVIDFRYKSRYQEWKNEFLSTDIGRAQWEMYAHHPRLVLTITIAVNNPNGAATGRYKWNSNGELIAATIVLGRQVDQGYPSSVYYPVMNALEPFESKQLIGGSVLA